MKKAFILLILICLIVPHIYAQNTNNSLNKLNTSQINFDFNQQIKVPDNLQIPAKVIFGITGEIEFQLFIILIVLWFGILVLITQILKFVPIIKQGVVSWLTAFIITCLVALSGGLHQTVLLIFSFSSLFELLKKILIVNIIFSITSIIIIVYGISILLKILRKNIELDKAEVKGRDVKLMTEKAKIESESLKKKSKE